MGTLAKGRHHPPTPSSEEEGEILYYRATPMSPELTPGPSLAARP